MPVKKAFIIFVRTPMQGRVKTRLQRTLGSTRTLRIYKSFITDTLKRCDDMKGVDKFMGCYPSADGRFITGLSTRYKLRLFNQSGRDLGEKFISAFHDRFDEGYKKVVIIGSDSPTIPAAYIRLAFRELEKNDFVLGPCTDGGYYLVGAKKISEKVFRGIPWDSPQVLNTTLDKLHAGNVRYSLLPFWYDIDDIGDLEFYKRHARYLKNAMKD